MISFHDAWLFLLGLFIGAFGTMIGAGGGFVLVPILLFLYPNDSPEVITATSLAVVFCNATSGSIAYARKKRIDYRSALAFALVSLPGAVLGAFATESISRRRFDPLFGAGLILVGAYLALGKAGRRGEPRALGRTRTRRAFSDAEGTRFEYAFDLRLGLAVSAGVGFVSSFLGIGGGIIHVPALVFALGFPVHVATATSHFILSLMSLTASVQHFASGSLDSAWGRLLFLAPGVVLGAPVGAKLSERVRGGWILRALAVALLAVGLRLLFTK